MRTITTFLFLLALTGSLAAQEADYAVRRILSPTWAWMQAASSRVSNQAFNSGQGTIVYTQSYLASPEGQTELGLSEEQRQKLAYLNKPYGEIVGDWFRTQREQEGSELMQVYAEIWELMPKDDRLLEKATPEEIQAYQEQYMQLAGRPVQLLTESLQQEIESILTPEQMGQLRVVELQVCGGTLSSPAFLEPVGLTDEQRAELAELQKERQAEFDRILDEITENHLEELYKLQDEIAEIHKVTPMKTGEDTHSALQAAQKKLEQDPEWKKRREEERLSTSKRLSEISQKYREKFMDVLTDEQLDKMQWLIDNPSETVKRYLAKFHGKNASSPSGDAWRPGPNSWKPGDGLPKDFKIERQEKRFPSRNQ